MHDRLTSASSLHGTLWTGRERDACGTGFVASIDGERGRRVIDLALSALERIAHRGAVDAGDDGGEPTGDGAGVLTQVPWALLERELPACRDAVQARRAGVAMCFLPSDPREREHARDIVQRAAAPLDVTLIGWRVVPVDVDALGAAARATLPTIEQAVFELPTMLDADQHEAMLYRLRREIERAARAEHSSLYVASCSTRTIVYKGLVVGHQLRRCFPDLSDADYRSSLAVFHQRYSTNTFPAWERAQPCRIIAHNGEINTLHGNVAWMRARGWDLGWKPDTAGSGDDGSWLLPIIDEAGSDSSMLDDAVQLLVHGGRALPSALTMLVPPAWDHDQDLQPEIRDLLRARAATSEPWDGPAAIAFSDGTLVGACLDRNGLRPARWLQTSDGLVACASETGAVPIPEEDVTRSGRLGPGQMLLVDLGAGTVQGGDEVLEAQATSSPWGVVVAAQQADVEGAQHSPESPPERDADGDASTPSLTALHALFGYTREELTATFRPMLATGTPVVGSMGDDTPVAALATQPRSLFGFARQGFAEVTNPPIDPLRERSSMSLDTIVGPRPRLLARNAEGKIALRLRSPLLTDDGMTSLRATAAESGVRVAEVSTLMPAGASLDGAHVAAAVEALCATVEAEIRGGADIIVLSDRGASIDAPPLPAMLAGSAVHQHLLDGTMRINIGLVFETGEVRDPHHLAVLIGYGIDAVCPWLALETATELATGARSRLEISSATAHARLIDALEYGLRTAMSRMGISTVAGYCGAQVFETIGLAPELTDQHLRGTTSHPGRIGWTWIAEQIERQCTHAQQWSAADTAGALPLPSPGFYKFKRGGELHGFEPAVVNAMHAALAVEDPLGAGFDEAVELYRTYSSTVHDRAPIDLRDLLEVRADSGAIPIDEVESIDAIVRRFSTGAMSHGSIGVEAHETLAEAMNLIGAWSNSGEGGEDLARIGTSRNSAIKQVASGRFGVTPAYLRSARELQIKIAQGSKPGEGGHLPGHKVTEEIARIRHTLPGVSLISPPPHHDIYSIEDLAQLIHDLASIHPEARISVKLVSQAGVGTIAAGVAKAHAATIVVSGACGGTGASPLGSIKHAGMPWEWGLAETQQVLVANRLRGRVRLRVDGGLRTGRDVLVAALLGADEFSFGTAALIAEGCRMARTCHNDQCPVGIATQRADLRALFPGQPEQVATFLLLVAQELRELLAGIGARSVEDVVGRVELLEARGDVDGVLELDGLLARPDVPASWPRRDNGEPNEVPGIHDGLDARIARELWPDVLAAGSGGDAVQWTSPIGNVDRSVGARLSGHIAEHIESTGIEPDRVHLRFHGTAGQSFGAFAIRGLRLELIGEANDFVGKGLAGANIDVRFPDASPRAAAAGANVLLGNACLYGATSGQLLAAGCAGERFAVRNSGAEAVIEGAGDHVCEYMTGGTVVVLGAVGRNIASGMSGGVLWILDDAEPLDRRIAATAQIIEPTPEELDELHRLLELHAARTSSARTRALLDNWTGTRERMRCIAPRDRVAAAVTLAG